MKGIKMTGKNISIILASAVLFLGGCYSSNPEDIEFFTKPDEKMVTMDEYILQPPDKIKIIAAKVPELHEKEQQIRPDGMISFEGVGQIKAAGKTPEQLSEAVYKKAMLLYSLTGENPIDIQIAQYRSSFYYVMGQVEFQGPMPCTGRDTVLLALTRSRPTVMAWKENILVVRPTTDPEKNSAKVFKVNLKDMLHKGDLSKNVYLEEGDIIYVPPTILSSLGLTVEEIVRPIARAFSTVNMVQGPPAQRID
mgnify:CR=1 FL=1